MNSLQCPQCGAGLPTSALGSKLVQCTHCHTALLLERQGEPVVKPSLLNAGHVFHWRGQNFRAQGHVQFAHAEGLLREWRLVREADGAIFWLGENDESWFLLQDVACESAASLHWSSLQPNRQLALLGEEWLVTEKYALQCLGTQGVMAETCRAGAVFRQVYLARPDASILLLIWDDGGLHCRRGDWLDPFEIRGAS